MQTHGLFDWLLAAAMVCALPAAGADSFRLMVDEATVSVLHQDQAVMRYRYGGVPFKPYVDQLTTPSGVNILRDAPEDHLHHHALMYAVKLNGINYWEEKEAPGRELHARWTSVDVRPEAAGFVELVQWKAPAEDTVLAEETRTITLHRVEGVDATLLTWAMAMRAAGEPVELTGAHYHGLGMRFLVSMDANGRFMNANDDPGELVQGSQMRTRGRWCVYQAEADGKPVTVAMFDSPENAQPVTWFTMTKTFAYMSATLESDRKPLQLGELILKYGVAVWDGHVDREQIEAVYQRWLMLASSSVATPH
ncbi:MAG: PmoA family protein [Candidatus Hydrogenedentes bacterium]|nr:PmoA family protein [Candidatus Hydrogenedentota bacterium]